VFVVLKAVQTPYNTAVSSATYWDFFLAGIQSIWSWYLLSTAVLPKLLASGQSSWAPAPLLSTCTSLTCQPLFPRSVQKPITWRYRAVKDLRAMKTYKKKQKIVINYGCVWSETMLSSKKIKKNSLNFLRARRAARNLFQVDLDKPSGPD